GQRRSGGGTAHLLLGALRRWLLRRGRGRALHRGEILALRDELDLPALEDLALQERGGELLEDVAPVEDDLAGLLVALADDPLDLAVDQNCGRLGVVLVLGELAAEEDLLVLLPEGERAHVLAHPPLADHLPGELRRVLDVAAGARRPRAEEDLLRQPA